MKAKDLIERARYWVKRGGGLLRATLVELHDPDIPWTPPKGYGLVWFDDKPDPTIVNLARVHRACRRDEDPSTSLLEPCPFCGEDDRIRAGVMSCSVQGVQCERCRAKIEVACVLQFPDGYDSLDEIDTLAEREARRRWNRRTS